MDGKKNLLAPADLSTTLFPFSLSSRFTPVSTRELKDETGINQLNHFSASLFDRLNKKKKNCGSIILFLSHCIRCLVSALRHLCVTGF